jgi:hypothetical protein
MDLPKILVVEDDIDITTSLFGHSRRVVILVEAKSA